jgi:PAS domain S-box-containing protein
MTRRGTLRRKRKAAALPKNLDEMILRAFDYMTDGVIIGRLSDGVVLYHNKAWLRIHALDETTDMRGKAFREYERPELKPILDKVTAEIMKRGSYTYQFGTVRRDGVYHDVHISANVVRECDPPVVIVILREVTGLVQMQKEIARRNVELELLNEIHRLIARVRSKKQVMRLMLKLLGDFIGAKGRGLYLVDHQNNRFVRLLSEGLPPKIRRKVDLIDLTDSVFAKIAHSRHTIVIEEDLKPRERMPADIRPDMGFRRTVGIVFRTRLRNDYLVIFGLMEATTIDPDVRSLLDTAANQFGIALERVELFDALEKRETELNDLTVRLLDAGEDERRQFSRMLHDDVGQALTALKLELEMLEKDLSPLNPCALKSLEAMRRQIRFVSEGTRSLSKSLHPAMLDELGLVPTLTWYLDTFVRSERLEAELTEAGCDKSIPPTVSLALYRVAQEALTNIVRHAKASRVTISLTLGFPYAIMEIEDNGKGISRTKGNNESKGLGLVSMRERVEILGGAFQIKSSPGKGTRIRVKIPIEGRSG